MIDFISIFGAGFKKEASCSHKAFAKVEASVGAQLPDDYKKVLLWLNGGEGRLGDLYISIWPIEKVLDLNALYSISMQLGKGFIGIGTDGGDYCFALDLRNPTTQFAVVPLGALAASEIRYLAKNMLDGLIGMRDQRITGDNL